jgi:hypothetical protein
MVKPTDKSLSVLKKQEANLERAMTKYPNSQKVAKAESITEAQIRAKGGSATDSARVAAIKRRLQGGGKKGGSAKS